MMEKTWVKCSDRLPDNDGCKLVTIWGSDIVMPKDGESVWDAMERQRKEIRYVDTAYYDAENKEWTGEYGFPLIVPPVAWMDFPEVYNESKY